MAYPSSSCLAENLGANLEASQRPERCYARPMADLERILQQLHDSEINAGVAKDPLAVCVGSDTSELARKPNQTKALKHSIESNIDSAGQCQRHTGVGVSKRTQQTLKPSRSAMDTFA
jgi:hypothetical protein